MTSSSARRSDLDPSGPAERLRRAFSLRRNVRSLLVPPDGHLRPLDGLRAISILWVIVFHAAWYSAVFVPLPVYLSMLLAPSTIAVWRGDFGVDIFFVLSGFLIAGMLIDERERTGRLRLGLFYARRLLRLWPALAIAVVADVLVIGDNAARVWANLLYVSNFLPIADVAMAWTWSLGIEEQFYLLCPWLVRALAPLAKRPGLRLGVLFTIAAALCCVGAWVVIAERFHAADTEIVLNRDLAIWARGYDHLYVKPWMRAGPLLVGVAAAYVHRARRAMDALSTSGLLGGLGLVAALAMAVAATHWPLVEHAPRGVEIAFMATYRTAFGLGLAYVLLLSLSDHPVGRALGRILSSRLLYPIGQLAYSAYLLNPIIAFVVHRAFASMVWTGQPSPMQIFLPLDLAGTLVAAAVLHLLVERPFMELRPRSREQSPSIDDPGSVAVA